MLTSDQVDLFQAFGFLHLRQAFDAEETAFIQREFDAAIRRSGVDPDTTEIAGADRGLLAGPARLVSWTHDMIHGIADKLLGEQFQFEGVQLRHLRLRFAVARRLGRDPLAVAAHQDRALPRAAGRRQRRAAGDPRHPPGTGTGSATRSGTDVPDYFFGLKNRDVIWQYPPFGARAAGHAAPGARHPAGRRAGVSREPPALRLRHPVPAAPDRHLLPAVPVARGSGGPPQITGGHAAEGLLPAPLPAHAPEPPRWRAMVTGLQDLGFPEGGPDS